MSTPAKILTWPDLAKLEPRLMILLSKAQKENMCLPENYCASEAWVFQFRSKLRELVGWAAPEDALSELRTREAWDTAYRVIYDALPPCNDCGCLDGEAWTNPEHVYCIRAGESDYYKFGLTGSLEKRLRSLQTGNHLPLKVIASKSCYFANEVEQLIHETLAEVRVGGEWFKITDPPLLAETLERFFQ